MRILFFLLITATAMASEGSPRTKHRFGFYLSTLNGDPKPPRIGLNAAWNATDWMRFTGGAGITGTVGGGVKFLVPGWKFTPALGVNVAKAGPIPGWVRNLDLFHTCTGKPGTTCVYPTHMFDWTLDNGFNVGFGPFLVNLGYYF